MKQTQNFLSALLVATLLTSTAEARRHRKFKGVVIVNQILKLTGKLTRNGEEAPEYSGVKQGDVLETLDKSEAVIRIPGLAILRMGANTQFKLTKFNDRNESRFELTNGDLLALFRRVGDHEVLLNHTSIKLHGTTFYAVTSKEGKFDKVCLDEGKIDVSVRENRKPQGSSGPSVLPAAVPPAVPSVSATPLYHATLSAATPANSPLPTAVPVVVATPPTVKALPKQIQLATTGEHKQCEVSDDGIEIVPDAKLVDLHPITEIKELESLYALP